MKNNVNQGTLFYLQLCSFVLHRTQYNIIVVNILKNDKKILFLR